MTALAARGPVVELAARAALEAHGHAVPTGSEVVAADDPWTSWEVMPSTCRLSSGRAQAQGRVEALEEQPLAPRQEQAEAHGLFLGSGMGRTPLLVGLPCPLVAASVAVHAEHPWTGA